MERILLTCLRLLSDLRHSDLPLCFATMSDAQPQPIPAMTVAGNRNAKNLPVGPDGRDWSYGLCSKSGSWGTCA